MIWNVKTPRLAKDVVHIWRLPLELSAQEREFCLSLLSAEEKVRAGKFYFEIARDHFIVGRGLLRCLLGSYLDTEPARLEINYEPQGKPVLKDTYQGLPLQFNISHSEGFGILAVCLDRHVGVDIEWLRPMADMDDLAQRFFTIKESLMLASLAEKDRQEFFYKIWTCKEAYLKALGAGLLLPLDQVEVKFEADGRVRLVSKEGVALSAWQLRMFNPQVNYQSALCIEGGDVEVIFQDLDL